MLEKAVGYKKNRLGSYLVIYGGVLLAAILLFLSFGFVISVHDQNEEKPNEIKVVK